MALDDLDVVVVAEHLRDLAAILNSRLTPRLMFGA
jgi:hypothetical protein